MGIVLLVALAGCGASPTQATSALPSRTTKPVVARVRLRAGTAVTVYPVEGAKPQPGGPHPAVLCGDRPALGRYVDDVIGPDTPNPTCLVLAQSQRIEITNGTDRYGYPGYNMTIRLPGFPLVTLRPEESAFFDAPVSNYFAPGGRVVLGSPNPGGPAVLVVR